MAVNVGTTAIAFKYKDGIIFACDTGITYGSMAKVKGAQKIKAIGEETLITCSGEMADFQNLEKKLLEMQEADEIENDGATFLHSKDYWNMVGRMQYQKRCKNSPILVTSVIGGINPKTKDVFLGQSDFHGLKLEKDYIVTGLGGHYCGVLFGNRWSADMSK